MTSSATLTPGPSPTWPGLGATGPEPFVGGERRGVGAERPACLVPRPVLADAQAAGRGDQTQLARHAAKYHIRAQRDAWEDR